MALTAEGPGRRERNKRDKLERITAAAHELFTRHGVDDVTTQQIAEKADIGTGTLFLYAKTKGELLLLVQNSAYDAALARGIAEAATKSSRIDAVMAIVQPIVECNRAQIDNGRTYLREVVFGDPEEPHHRQALELVARTEVAISEILQRDPAVTPERAAVQARVVSSITFLTLSTTLNIGLTNEQLNREIADQIGVLDQPSSTPTT